jgi:hypothetical protein
MSEDALGGFAPPPFQAAESLQRLQRELRALGLKEREGRFERAGLPIARAETAGDTLSAARVKRPSRTPDWQARTLRSGADVRDFVADLKKQLALWSDRDD